MAYYWLNACELGKTMIALSDLMCSPGLRKNNYYLRLYLDPVNKNARKFLVETDANKRKSYVVQSFDLDFLIKVSFKNIRFKSQMLHYLSYFLII